MTEKEIDVLAQACKAAGIDATKIKPENPFSKKAKETRTPDPLHAMQVLYQLSYGPITTWWLQNRRSSCDSLHRKGFRPDARRQQDGPAPPPVQPEAQSVDKRDWQLREPPSPLGDGSA